MTERSPRESSPLKGWDKMHKRVSSHPLPWVFTADKLMRGFITLAEQAKADIPNQRENLLHAPELWGAARFLGALAIENLLKAICVAILPSPFDAKGRFTLRSHNLLKLADIAKIQLTSDEKVLLERLRTCIEWRGRYPVPLLSEDMAPDWFLVFGERYPLGSPQFSEILDLAKKLRKLIPNSDVPYESFSIDV